MREVERVVAEVVEAGGAPAPPSGLGLPARSQYRIAQNRNAVIAGLLDDVTDTLERIYTGPKEVEVRGVRRLEDHDDAVAGMGEVFARGHEIAKKNLSARLADLRERTAEALVELHERNMDQALTLPDAAFYRPTARDQWEAFLAGRHIELEARGLPNLTFGEEVREVFFGDVVDRKTARHDARQVAERRQAVALQRRLAEAQAQITALVERNEQLEAGERPLALPAPAAPPTADTVDGDAVEPSLAAFQAQADELEALLARLPQANAEPAEPAPVPMAGRKVRAG